MPRYTAWKTVIDGTEKKHRGQNATYTWLNESALNLPDGTRIAVLVQEQHAGDHWYTYEDLVVRNGQLNNA